MTIGVHDYRLSNSIAVATSVGITQKKYDALVSLRATLQWFMKICFSIHFATCVCGVSMALKGCFSCPRFLHEVTVALSLSASSWTAASSWTIFFPLNL